MFRSTHARRTKPEDLRDSLVAMDLSKFDMDKLIALRGISPSMEHLAELKKYDGELSKLDEVSRRNTELFTWSSCDFVIL